MGVGEKVGAHSLRRMLVTSSANTLSIGLQSSEAFGQHESLTSRLKHILQLYPDGPGILNELIQNADDAGATEVSVMLNMQAYADRSLLGTNMADWQGPALYVYNNAVFSPRDYVNLSRIGQDSKMEKTLQTGRFGLGFNAVYHFTDVPSFVSGDHLVIFDPHTSFLPGASPGAPGLKIDVASNRLLSAFPDQFRPYLFFGCTLESRFNGTLFRFPLRTASTAKTSEIKQNASTVRDIQDLLESFRANAMQTLLFLKTVRRIRVFEHSASASGEHEQKLLYEVRVSNSGAITTDTEHIPRFVGGTKESPLDRGQFRELLEQTRASELPQAD